MLLQVTKAQLWNQFATKKYCANPAQQHVQRSQQFIKKDFDNLICHAKIRQLANKYEIDELKVLSLHKLQQTLIHCPGDLKRSSKVVTLLRHVYQSTFKSNEPDRELRKLIVRYLAFAVEDLAFNPEFQALLKEENELGADLVVGVLSKLR